MKCLILLALVVLLVPDMTSSARLSDLFRRAKRAITHFFRKKELTMGNPLSVPDKEVDLEDVLSLREARDTLADSIDFDAVPPEVLQEILDNCVSELRKP